MVKLGVIGRNFVVDWLLEAAEKVPEIQPVAVCSRDPEAAKPFAEKYKIFGKKLTKILPAICSIIGLMISLSFI